ncbi:VOC family protein [Paenibacillus sp.]|jgi:predicted enzyme related to lactoylglutathione lyase|uniref:VOC family protein n=1 Tax=Paenibacillus sp. TaxID=58172 RepID=UPI00282310B6|nr:VOC family protein [Paenibacillus sp.]MDR0268169.1 VOC family protein [Paenibacillus sp.]
MTAKSLHIQVIELPVKDVAKAVRWYTEVFNVGFCFPFSDGDDAAWLNLNGIALGLVEAMEVPKFEFVSSKGERKPVLTFQVDNIHELRSELSQKGVSVGDMLYKQDGGYSFQLVDPSGNLLGVWGGWPKEGELPLGESEAV